MGVSSLASPAVIQKYIDTATSLVQIAEDLEKHVPNSASAFAHSPSISGTSWLSSPSYHQLAGTQLARRFSNSNGLGSVGFGSNQSPNSTTSSTNRQSGFTIASAVLQSQRQSQSTVQNQRQSQYTLTTRSAPQAITKRPTRSSTRGRGYSRGRGTWRGRGRGRGQPGGWNRGSKGSQGG